MTTPISKVIYVIINKAYAKILKLIIDDISTKYNISKEELEQLFSTEL